MVRALPIFVLLIAAPSIARSSDWGDVISPMLPADVAPVPGVEVRVRANRPGLDGPQLRRCRSFEIRESNPIEAVTEALEGELGALQTNPSQGERGTITVTVQLHLECQGGRPARLKDVRVVVEGTVKGPPSDRVFRRVTNSVITDSSLSASLPTASRTVQRSLTTLQDDLLAVRDEVMKRPELSIQAAATVQLSGGLTRQLQQAESSTLPRLDKPHRTAERRPNDAAVIVGLERYPFLPDVPYASRDARAFHGVAMATLGIPDDHITLLTSASAEQITAAVERAADQAQGGRVWLFFAGHGAADPSTRGRLLLGDDTRADPLMFASRGVKVDDLVASITRAGSTPLLILDACYTGAGRDGAPLVAGTRFVVPTYALEASDSLQWAAAAPDQISGPLPAVEQGAFTYFAVGALRGWADGAIDGVRDGEVTAAEANAYVSRALAASQIRGQTPVWHGPPDTVLATGVSELGPEL